MRKRVRTVAELQRLDGAVVLVRGDLDVPLTEVRGTLKIANDRRLQDILPTLNHLRSQNARIVVMGHLGRPNGTPSPTASLVPIQEYLVRELKIPIAFASSCIGAERDAKIAELKPGSVLLLENTRFFAEEKKNGQSFAKALAKNCDYFVNESFASAHRAHASTVGVTEFLPSYAGLHLAEELAHWDALLSKPKRPFVMIVGGRKISDKLLAIQKLTELADVVLVGGGIANNFIKADGHPVYKSYMEEASTAGAAKARDYVAVADELLEETEADKILIKGYIPLPKIIYPTDVVAAVSLESRRTKLIDLTDGTVDEANQRHMFLDIGPKTQRLYAEIIQQAATIFWNGPMGVFEKNLFSAGTAAITDAVSKSKATSILGGGDTLSAVEQLSDPKKFDYISSAGGAALEYLSGAELPALLPLQEKD